MSPKWQRPTGTEKESGVRTYVSGKEYPEQMRTKTDKAALDEKPFHLSEFKKPYEADSYEEMEHFFSWPQGHRPGFDSPMEESGKTTYEYKDPLEWDPALNVKAIKAYDSDTVGVIQNEGKCKWKLDESGLTSGLVTMVPTGKNDINCVLSPSIDADGSFSVRVTDSRKKNKWIWRSIDVTPKVAEMLIAVSVLYFNGSSVVPITRYFKVSDLIVNGGDLGDFWNDGYGSCLNKVDADFPPAWLTVRDPANHDRLFPSRTYSFDPPDCDEDYIGMIDETVTIPQAGLWYSKTYEGTPQLILDPQQPATLCATIEQIDYRYNDPNDFLYGPVTGDTSLATYGWWDKYMWFAVAPFTTTPCGSVVRLRHMTNVSCGQGILASGHLEIPLIAEDATGTEGWNAQPTLTDTYYVHFGEEVGLIELPSPLVATHDTSVSGWETRQIYHELNSATILNGTAWLYAYMVDKFNYCIIGVNWNGSRLLADDGGVIGSGFYNSGFAGVRIYGVYDGESFDISIAKAKLPTYLGANWSVASGIPYD